MTPPPINAINRSLHIPWHKQIKPPLTTVHTRLCTNHTICTKNSRTKKLIFKYHDLLTRVISSCPVSLAVCTEIAHLLISRQLFCLLCWNFCCSCCWVLGYCHSVNSIFRTKKWKMENKHSFILPLILSVNNEKRTFIFHFPLRLKMELTVLEWTCQLN